ncbi:MAG: M48 family metalloprotease [Kiritimatiellia bacterium]
MSTQTYLILVLVFLAGNYLLDLVSRVLNLRALSPEPPAEFRDALAAAFGLPHATVYAGLVCFSFLFTPIQVILGILTSALSRRFEYQADRYAAVTTGDSEALVAALKRLSADNHSHLTPHPFVVALSYSHPPVLARIRALRAGER